MFAEINTFCGRRILVEQFKKIVAFRPDHIDQFALDEVSPVTANPGPSGAVGIGLDAV